MKSKKILVFDMDGTITDLYSVPNWLTKITSSDPSPYLTAKPIYNMIELTETLIKLKKAGYTIAITTWLAKNATKEYNSLVRKAKKTWLKKYNFPYDELHTVKYGTTKADCTRHLGGFQILIDDNEKIRRGWHLGSTIDANKNILKELEKLL